MSERTLDRLIRAGLAIVAIGIAIEASDRLLGWRNGEESLLERQVAAAEKAVRAQPNETGPRLRLAEVYRAAERPDDALAQYDEVLAEESTQSTAWLGRGEILADEGEVEEAEKAFRKVIGKAGDAELATVDPQLEAAYYGLGSLLLEEGRARKAVAALRRAVEVEPTDADAWQRLGAAALGAGEPRLAVRALREAILFVPLGWCEPYEALADAYARLSRRPHARYAEAMVELCEERPTEATRRLRRLTAGPVAVDAMLGLGMAAELQSDRAAAARWYRRVLAADAGNFNARSNLGRLAGPPGGSPPGGHPDVGGA